MSKHIAEVYVDKLLQSNVPISLLPNRFLGCGTGDEGQLLCSDCPYNTYTDCSTKRAWHAEIMGAYIKQTYPEILL